METKFLCQPLKYYWTKFHNSDFIFPYIIENNVNNKTAISATSQPVPLTILCNRSSYVCFLFFQHLYISLFSQFIATSKLGFTNNVLFVAHTDTHWWSISFTDQQTDTQVDLYFCSCKKQDINGIQLTNGLFTQVWGVSFRDWFLYKHRAMNSLYALTSFIMLHKTASLQLTYPVTFLLLKHLFNLLFMLLEGVTYFGHGILSLWW